MIAAIALLLAAPTVSPQEPPPAVPSDWTTMPLLPWRSSPVLSPEIVGFVEDEVRAGRCASASATIAVEIAVFVRADGRIRAAVPRAIDCPTVEQFTAGLVTSFARNNLRLPAAGWYRATISFDRAK